MSPLRSSAGPAVWTNGHLELGGEDLRQRRLAQAGRAGEQDVVERLAARPRGLDARPTAAPAAPSWPTKSSQPCAGAASGRARPRARRSSGVWMRSPVIARAARSALASSSSARLALGRGEQPLGLGGP